jgi:16S rRNA (uracil1498-N3)-methyltransferase
VRPQPAAASGEVGDFGAWIGQHDLHKRILLSPRAEQPLSDWARHQPPQAVTLMVGPEGGFSEAGGRGRDRHGALALGMGPRVLRTETAGLAALAARRSTVVSSFSFLSPSE